MTENRLTDEIKRDKYIESHIENDGTYKYFLNSFEEYEERSLQDTDPATVIKILRSDLSVADKHELEILSHRRTLRGLPTIEKKSITDALVMVPDATNILGTLILRAAIGISSFDENNVIVLLKKEQDWEDVLENFHDHFIPFIKDDIYTMDDRFGYPGINKLSVKWCIKLDCGEEKQITFSKDISSLDEDDCNLLLVQDVSDISYEEYLELTKKCDSKTTSKIMFSSIFDDSTIKMDKALIYYLMIKNISCFGDSLFLWR